MRKKLPATKPRRTREPWTDIDPLLTELGYPPMITVDGKRRCQGFAARVLTALLRLQELEQEAQR